MNNSLRIFEAYLGSTLDNYIYAKLCKSLIKVETDYKPVSSSETIIIDMRVVDVEDLDYVKELETYKEKYDELATDIIWDLVRTLMYTNDLFYLLENTIGDYISDKEKEIGYSICEYVTLLSPDEELSLLNLVKSKDEKNKKIFLNLINITL